MKNKKEIVMLDSIKNNHTKLLWYADKYDGMPHCGLMLFNGRKCWYRVYDMDITQMRYSDEDLLKSGYWQDQLELMNEDDREWHHEVFYYKIYKLSNRDLLNIEDAHDKFREKWGTHTDYDYQPLTVRRDKDIDYLLDNLFLRKYKQILKFLRRNKKNIKNDNSNGLINTPKKVYEKDIIGHFKIT